jgi:RNA polymerase sigma factor (sigma-70 family)
LIHKKIVLSEEELIDALRQKTKIGYDALYDMYSAALYGIIFRIVQVEETAEDVVQETFVRIWNSFSSYDSSKGRLFTWMMNLARNMAIDKVRSKEFKNSNKNQDIENNVSSIDVANNTAYKPELLGIKDLLTHLKPEQREIVDYVYFKGYTHTEVSDEMGIPLGTVKTRLRMGIIELRKFFN